jgi:ABC-type phosphate/phosphonate transport system substrate-binding protein
MLATLPMYDWPELREATDALWRAIANRLDLAVTLDRTMHHHDSWRDSQLLFSQTCGYPLTHEFEGRLRYVATPHYDADGCEGPLYSSILFAREKKPVAEFRGARAAINTPDSLSGMLALKLMTARKGFFAEEILTGSHIQSLIAVRDGKADLCAIDAICVALARRHQPDMLINLHEVARSPLVPGLPYVTRVGSLFKLRQALSDVCTDPTLNDARQALLLTTVSVLPDNAYDVIPALERALL